MKCPYLKTKLYIRNIGNSEIEEEKETFCDCLENECPYYQVDKKTYDYTCKKVELEIKGE